MTVDFRTVALAKGADPDQLQNADAPRRSPAAFVLTVVLAVASALCAVAWIFG